MGSILTLGVIKSPLDEGANEARGSIVSYDDDDGDETILFRVRMMVIDQRLRDIFTFPRES